MANVVSSTPYSFTSAMAASFHNTSGSTPASGPINIQSIVWETPAHVGDEVTVTDGSGMTLAHWVANKQDVANGAVQIPLQAANAMVKDFQVTAVSSGTLYITPATAVAATGVAGGAVTTKGTAIPAGTAQAQTALSVVGATANSAVSWAVDGSLPASWQTGIMVVPVVSNDTVTLYLVNPTASSITPVAATINVRIQN